MDLIGVHVLNEFCDEFLICSLNGNANNGTRLTYKNLLTALKSTENYSESYSSSKAEY